MKKQRIDIKEEVTNQIIQSLENGNIAPWTCPWIKTGENAIPYNFSTSASYSGINILLLWMSAMNKGFTRNGWLTFKQAKELGGQVRKGEKGTRAVIYKPFDKEVEKENGKQETETRYYINHFVLFNVDQIDGLELPELQEPIMIGDQEAVEMMNEIATKYADRTGLKITFGGDNAVYYACFDTVKMPTTCKTGGDYVATLAHELGHSTGHKKRLNRYDDSVLKFTNSKEEYAYDELVAELCSHMFTATLGVEGQHEQHVSYIDHWLTHLKKDKGLIFRAAGAASKAFDLIMNNKAAKAKKSA